MALDWVSKFRVGLGLVEGHQGVPFDGPRERITEGVVDRSKSHDT